MGLNRTHTQKEMKKKKSEIQGHNQLIYTAIKYGRKRWAFIKISQYRWLVCFIFIGFRLANFWFPLQAASSSNRAVQPDAVTRQVEAADQDQQKAEGWVQQQQDQGR